MSRKVYRQRHFYRRRSERTDLTDKEVAELGRCIRNGESSPSLYLLKRELHCNSDARCPAEVWRLIRRGKAYTVVWSVEDNCLTTIYSPHPQRLVLEELHRER